MVDWEIPKTSPKIFQTTLWPERMIAQRGVVLLWWCGVVVVVCQWWCSGVFVVVWWFLW